MKAIAYCVTIIATLLIDGCGNPPIDPSKLIGDWKVGASAPRSLVFTFREDHSYIMAATGKSGGIVGRWKLEGNRLAMVTESVTNQMGAMSLPTNAYSSQTIRIASLTDKVMVWREPGQMKALTLKRLPTK